MSEIKYNKKRLKKVESILISQPKPSNDASPFYKLVNQGLILFTICDIEKK